MNVDGWPWQKGGLFYDDPLEGPPLDHDLTYQLVAVVTLIDTSFSDASALAVDDGIPIRAREEIAVFGVCQIVPDQLDRKRDVYLAAPEDLR